MPEGPITPSLEPTETPAGPSPSTDPSLPPPGDRIHWLTPTLAVVIIVLAVLTVMEYHRHHTVAVLPIATPLATPVAAPTYIQKLNNATRAVHQSLIAADSSMTAATESLNDQEGNLSEQ